MQDFIHPADALGAPSAVASRGAFAHRPRKSLLALSTETRKATLEERAARVQTYAVEVLVPYLKHEHTLPWTSEVKAFEGTRDAYFSALYLSRQHLEIYIPRTVAASLTSTSPIPVALIWANRASFLHRVFAANPFYSPESEASQNTSHADRYDLIMEVIEGFGWVVPWKEWREGSEQVLQILIAMKTQSYILSLLSDSPQDLEALFSVKLSDHFQPPTDAEKKAHKRKTAQERKAEPRFGELCQSQKAKLDQARKNAQQLVALFPYEEMIDQIVEYMNQLCHSDLSVLLEANLAADTMDQAREDQELDIVGIMPTLESTSEQDIIRNLTMEFNTSGNTVPSKTIVEKAMSEVNARDQFVRDQQSQASSSVLEYSTQPQNPNDFFTQSTRSESQDNASQLQNMFWAQDQRRPTASVQSTPIPVERIKFGDGGRLERVIGTKGKAVSMLDRQSGAVKFSNFDSQSQPPPDSPELRRGTTYESYIDPNLQGGGDAHNPPDIPIAGAYEDENDRNVYANAFEQPGDLGVGVGEFPGFDANLERDFMEGNSSQIMQTDSQHIEESKRGVAMSGQFLDDSSSMDETSKSKVAKKKRIRTNNKRPNRGKPKARELPPQNDPPSDGELTTPVNAEKYNSVFNKYRLDRNGPVQRRFWTPGGPEEELLILCLNRYGALARPWHEILKRYGANGTKGDLFKDQNNVSLKDHARSIKNRYVREGLDMPPGLQHWVTAKKSLRVLEEQRKLGQERQREREQKELEEHSRLQSQISMDVDDQQDMVEGEGSQAIG